MTAVGKPRDKIFYNEPVEIKTLMNLQTKTALTNRSLSTIQQSGLHEVISEIHRFDEKLHYGHKASKYPNTALSRLLNEDKHSQ